MSKDPLGLLARMNAMSLMMITPEFYRVRRLRKKGAAQVKGGSAPFAMQTQHMQLDGQNIRYAQVQNPGKPTVLFLSPLPQSILCYDTVWAQLADVANLVAVDLPGFGRSEGRADQMTFAAQAAFLGRFVDAMDLSDAHIVAPDIAMPVALTYAMQADHRARSVMVGDGPGILPSKDGSLIKKIVGSGFWRTMVRLNGARTFIAGALQLGYLHYSPSAAEVEDYVHSYAGRIGQVTQYFKHYPEGCKTLTENIASVRIPVKVFWGDEDAFLSAENAQQLSSQLKDGSTHIFKNCGHFCYQDKSGEFAEMVRAWIKG